ncbi:MAG: hypothetical protein ACR2FU_11500 [Streptosporangiaceae bacterium]
MRAGPAGVRRRRNLWLVLPPISHSPKQKISPSAIPAQNTPSVLSVASVSPKICGVKFGPPALL